MSNKIAIFADKSVGAQSVEFLLNNYPDHVGMVVLVDEKSDLLPLLNNFQYPKKNIHFYQEIYQDEFLNKLKLINIDYIILAWWPFIIKSPFFSIPQKGIINFHPSFLPFNRGKHYNFWTIVEETTFGVSLHFVDESIDGGDIIFQKKIDKTWEDTGETLYYKAQSAMFDLFAASYPLIISNNYTRIKQLSTEGSFHFGKEIERASEIILEKEYKAKDLLNLIRARTFPPHPAAWFQDGQDKYEVTINIIKK